MDENSTNKASLNARKKTCSRCQNDFSCYIENCWCSELPHVIPLSLSENEDCFCPECLKKMIADKEHSNLT